MSEEKFAHTEAAIEKAYAAYLLALAARKQLGSTPSSPEVARQSVASHANPYPGLGVSD
jgi:hypothetical protein